MLCSESTIVNLGNDQGRAVTLHCRSWSCEICHPRRCRELMALAHSGKPNTFITLTVDPSRGSSAETRAAALVAAWRLVLKRAKKRYSYAKVPFLAVFEATRRGEPHLHILCRVPWIDQRWLSDQMADLIGAPIVDIRRVRSKAKIAAYVAKYVGKAPHRFKGTKRYWRTQDWQLVKETVEDDGTFWSSVWEIRHYTLTEQEEAWRLLGWHTWTERGMLFGSGKDPPIEKLE